MNLDLEKYSVGKLISGKNNSVTLKLKKNFRLEESKFFVNSTDSVSEIVYRNNSVKCAFDGEAVTYLSLGDGKFNRLRTFKSYTVSPGTVVFGVNVDAIVNAKLSVFLQKFDNDKKLESISFPLNMGYNQFSLPVTTETNALKILFRISHGKFAKVDINNLTVCETDSFDMAESIRSKYNISIENNEIRSQEVDIESTKTNVLTQFKDGSDKLVVFLNGAVNLDKTPLPVFQRQSWLAKLPYSALVVMDPTIDAFLNGTDTTYINWYQGGRDFFLEKLSRFILDISKAIDVKKEDIIFYGSSAGGFASIIASSLVAGSKACVVNPQVDIRKYHKKYAEKLVWYLSECGVPDFEIDRRINAVEYLKGKPKLPQIFIKQNIQDTLHFEKHYSDLVEYYRQCGQEKRLISVLTDDPRGHSAIPKYDEAFEDINYTINKLGCEGSIEEATSKKLPLRVFGLFSNNSTLYDFKPREDCSSYKLEYPLDWNSDPFNDRNWKFQLNAWRQVDSALVTLEKEYSHELFNQVLDVIFDWHRFSIAENRINEFTWYDMATGLRAIKLALILNRLDVMPDKYRIMDEQRALIFEIAKYHLFELDRQELSINNHGIFQAHGQALLATVLNDKERINGAINKMEKLLEQQFNDDGFHVENSDKYHWFVLDTFVKYLKLSVYGNSSKIRKIIEFANEVKSWTVFPDRTALMIGDSEFKYRAVDFKKAKKDRLCNFSEDSFLLKYFPDSGYVFIRSDFSTPSAEASLLFLQTAFVNSTHRHADDFNILLYEFGVNVLVDAGQYAYSSDKERAYVTSTRAHNCLVVDGKDYDVKGKKYYESALKSSRLESGVFILETRLFRDSMSLSHSRYLLYKPGYFLVVVDVIDSQDLHKLEQIWHFNHELEVIENSLNYSTVINKNVNLIISPLVLLQHNKNDIRLEENPNSLLVKGQVEPELQGWRSLKYRELTANYALSNILEAKDGILATKFKFVDQREPEFDLDVRLVQLSGNNSIQLVSEALSIDLMIDVL